MIVLPAQTPHRVPVVLLARRVIKSVQSLRMTHPYDNVTKRRFETRVGEYNLSYPIC